MEPQQEALLLLKQMIQDLASPSRDLVSILRRCQHACQILDWGAARSWFHQELNGYSADTPLPAYRRIPGTVKWDFEGPAHNRVSWALEQQFYTLDPSVYDEEPAILDVRAGIAWLLAASRTGYREELQKAKEASSPSGKGRVKLRRVRVFQADSIANSVTEIEKLVFDWASSSYVQLQYGGKVADIWGHYRHIVDGAIQKLGLGCHLSAILDAMATNNPESWRVAALECRNLLSDLANYLWQDPRPTYENLPGSKPDAKLNVEEGNFANRLSAYLHQKGISGKRGKFLRDEVERLATSIRSLIAYQSTAHEPIDRADAESIVLATYITIGEIARRTDLQPVTEYGPL